MGDELLKKTGAGNLFMVFGEPDLDVKKQRDGKITVDIRGVDVYDPTTGQIRSHSTDDIACWFIDTDYNEESFLSAMLTSVEPMNPMKSSREHFGRKSTKTLGQSSTQRKASHSITPTTGKIAVKVINHYGDEVLKVYKV